MTSAVLVLRLITIFICAIAFGLSCAAIFFYVRTRDRLARLLPIESEHVVLISISYVGAVTTAIWNILDAIVHGEGFEWFQSPVLLTSMGCGVYGLVKLIHYERAVGKRRRSPTAPKE